MRTVSMLILEREGGSGPDSCMHKQEVSQKVQAQDQAGSGAHNAGCPLRRHHPHPHRGQRLCCGLCSRHKSTLTMLSWFAPLFPGFFLNAENPARCLGDHSSYGPCQEIMQAPSLKSTNEKTGQKTKPSKCKRKPRPAFS